MNDRQFAAAHDRWLNAGNPADEEDDEICDVCGECMEYEEDVDVDEDSGRAYVCGGGWCCTNKNCGEEDPEEQRIDGITQAVEAITEPENNITTW